MSKVLHYLAMDAMKPATRVSLSVLFRVLGFLGNWFKIGLYFNVDFLPGSFFVMLAIMTIGGRCGVIAGFVAGICTYYLWNHPWAIIIFTGEAIFVAWLWERRKGNPVIYDILYRVCLGMPMVYLFYHPFMGMQLQDTLSIMLRRFVNGIFNALVALPVGVLFTFIQKGDRARMEYSKLLFVAMSTLVILRYRNYGDWSSENGGSWFTRACKMVFPYPEKCIGKPIVTNDYPSDGVLYDAR